MAGGTNKKEWLGRIECGASGNYMARGKSEARSFVVTTYITKGVHSRLFGVCSNFRCTHIAWTA